MYLELLEKSGLSPNFFCSEEFRVKAGIEEKERDGYIYWWWNDVIVHPILNKTTGRPLLIYNGLNWVKEIWSDFSGVDLQGLEVSGFLDYEFIFDPKAFLHMDGGRWQVFRKNSRKFPRRFGNELYYSWYQKYVQIFGQDRGDKELTDVFVNWLKAKNPEEVIHGDDIMMNYLLNGRKRKVLYTPKGRIYGVNIWDQNFKYINYRFTFNRPEDFLSEHMRLQFYTDPEILAKNKSVNDGGCIGNEKLKAFKEKLNPIQIREVRSWKSTTFFEPINPEETLVIR